MNELARLLLFLGLAGSAVTFLGSAAIWFMEEERRINRGLKKVLKGDPEAVILAKGRGRGAGFRFSAGQMAVAWDSGGWCLIYKVDELIGAELIIEGEVAARTYRGEPRRLLDHVPAQPAEVTLRLIFDDARHPDFDLVLWRNGDDARRTGMRPAQAVQEANRWLSRAEAILRRSPAGRAAVAARQAPPAQAPLFQDDAPPPAATQAAAPPPAREPAPPQLQSGDDDLFAAPRSAAPAAAPAPARPAPPPWEDDGDDGYA